MIHGMRVFHSVAEALRAGFIVYDRTSNGYFARARIDNGWQIARIELVGGSN